MNYICAMFIIGSIIYGIYSIVELFARRRERILMIEKLSELKSFSGEDAVFDLKQLTRPSFGTLKIGCLLLGLGIGLLIGLLINTYMFYETDVMWSSINRMGIIYGSCMMIFGAIGSLTAFFIERKINRK